MRIFLSYRRDDSAGYAGRAYDRLVQHFGPSSVFMDVDAIEPGADFVDVVSDAVGSCDVLIVLIGGQWLDAMDHRGKRRLEDPHDFVHLEVAVALERNVCVIPALVRGAEMPREEELPPELIKLARRQAVELSDLRFHEDMGRLIEAIEHALARLRPPVDPNPPPPPVPTIPAAPMIPAVPTIPAAQPLASVGPLDEAIIRYRQAGYVERSRHGFASQLTKDAKINTQMLVGLILIFWPAAIVYAYRNSNKMYTVTLSLDAFGRVLEAGDTLVLVGGLEQVASEKGVRVLIAGIAAWIVLFFLFLLGL